MEDDGFYANIIPNSNFCFDASLEVSNIAEVLEAHLEKRTIHKISSVIEHYALTSHNDPQKHWKDNQKRINELDISKIESVLTEIANNYPKYYDVHAWQFNPISFSIIFNALIKLNKISFSKLKVFGNVFNRFEFIAIFYK